MKITKNVSDVSCLELDWYDRLPIYRIGNICT